MGDQITVLCVLTVRGIMGWYITHMKQKQKKLTLERLQPIL